jgi:hypothetical protein
MSIHSVYLVSDLEVSDNGDPLTGLFVVVSVSHSLVTVFETLKNVVRTIEVMSTLDMFFVYEQKMSVGIPFAAIRRSKGERWGARAFCRLQYTRKDGQDREWRVCVLTTMNENQEVFLFQPSWPLAPDRRRAQLRPIDLACASGHLVRQSRGCHRFWYDLDLAAAATEQRQC